MFNVTRDCENNHNAPWNQSEPYCPTCYGNFNHVKCDGINCEEEWCFDCENHIEDCEC